MFQQEFSTARSRLKEENARIKDESSALEAKKQQQIDRERDARESLDNRERSLYERTEILREERVTVERLQATLEHKMKEFSENTSALIQRLGSVSPRRCLERNGRR